MGVDGGGWMGRHQPGWVGVWVPLLPSPLGRGAGGEGLCDWCGVGGRALCRYARSDTPRLNPLSPAMLGCVDGGGVWPGGWLVVQN